MRSLPMMVALLALLMVASNINNSQLWGVEASVTELYAEHIEETIVKPRRDVFLMFNAPWCGYCKTMMPHFHELEEHLASDPNILLAEVNCQVMKKFCEKEQKVKNFPTIKLFKRNSDEVVIYSGSRKFEPMREWLEKHRE